MPQELDFGIVNFNGGPELLKCMQTILELNDINAHIFILDNASTDNSIAAAKKTFPHCTFIESDKNLGYAGACNRLIPYLKTEIVVLCNMDLEFHKDWGIRLLDCFNDHREAASVSTAVYDRETSKLYSGGVFFFHDLYPLSSETLVSPDEPYDVFGSYGAVMTFRREVFEKIGTFDEDYFLFFEETEFFLRMNVNGLRTLFCPAARVFHHRSIATVRYSPLKLFYSERNRLLTAFKYLPLFYFPFVFPLSAVRFLVMAQSSGIPGSDGRGKKVSKQTIILTIAKAWLAALLKLPGEWKKRRKLWNQTRQSPLDTLALIRKYPLSFSELKIR
jgi:GT2 family glycosyltransferase